MAGLKEIAKEAGLNPLRDEENGIRIDTTEVIDEFFKKIVEHCRAGETVHIKNFGTFKARVYKGRTLKSPLLEAGEVTFDDQLTLRFNQSAVAKRVLNIGYKGSDDDEPKATKKAPAKKASADKKASTTKKKTRRKKAEI